MLITLLSSAYQGLVTSRKLDDPPVFCVKIVEELAGGQHSAQARTV